MTTASRWGFSLMEVLLATGILLGSVVVLGELADIARRHANAAEELATAQRLCQNKLNEILAGLTALEPVEAEPLDGNVENLQDDELTPAIQTDKEPTWLHSVEIEPLDEIPLVSVRVRVWQAETDDEKADRRPRAFSLVRWMRDPLVDETGLIDQPAAADQ